ncbi:hypothetical protein Ae706Ps2_5290 [Pseudonocardia sp. Ae706_Ps2]|nr:hypothetical protein Ae331Ps2_0672c [Pseudonocardia sp. Ae331_Ps2]OLM26857.1 hypothetical protein Ae706Ps2_5290 [Pseudonocardia sp. Ae706_Ps2]
MIGVPSTRPGGRAPVCRPVPASRLQDWQGGRPTGTEPAGPERTSMSQPYPAESSRIAAILAHLSAPIAAILSAGLLSLVGPLLVWLVKKDDPFARRAAAGAFNFNLSFWVLFIVSWILIFTVVGILVAIPLMIALFVVSAWCHIKGAVRASNNRAYDYPFQLRVLS